MLIRTETLPGPWLETARSGFPPPRSAVAADLWDLPTLWLVALPKVPLPRLARTETLATEKFETARSALRSPLMPAAVAETGLTPTS